MNSIRILMLAGGLVLAAPAASYAQAGSTTLGATTVELREVAEGWSAKRSILGRDVYNDADERIGSIEDIIVAPDLEVSYAIVGAGGFLGVGRHDVAIPVSKFSLVDDKLVLPGATKQALEASPAFEYAP